VADVFVLGHRGMLGQTVARYLAEQGYDIVTSDRRYTGMPDDSLIEALRSSSARVIVNCIGVLRPDPMLMAVDALLPWEVAGLGRLVIHPSTDCVFRGDRGWYSVEDPPDAITTDGRGFYGLAKRMGEVHASNVVILRASIIAPSGGTLGWFLSQSGPIDGWTDHVWNGITTLAWARLAAAALVGDILPGLHQPTTEPITKYDLLRLFGEVFDHPIEVRPVSAGFCDRTLVPTIAMPPIRDQLTELRDWA
jgi:dTDP-4-dehydrorhamnose reductase